MNISQYKISEELARDVLVSVSRLPSIRQAIGGTEARDAAARAEKELQGDPETCIVEDVAYEYKLVPDGTACITRCASDAVFLHIPDKLGDRNVSGIGSHAFCTCYSLENVELPSHLSLVGEYSFMNTALREVILPGSVRFVGKNAFYKCASLQRVVLNEGLLVLGESAFRETALEELYVPASVAEIGQNAFKDTHLVFRGAGQTLTIDPRNGRYIIEDGVLYARGEDPDGSALAISGDGGKDSSGGSAVAAQADMLVQALDEDLVEYAGTHAIRAVVGKAFAGLKKLESVVLPEGTAWVGNGTFKGCKSLQRIEFPSSLEHIGRQALMDTALVELNIPASLHSAGIAAFYTGGSIARNFKRTIERVSIAPENTSFYMENDILCQHRPGEGDVAVLYVGNGERVVVPRAVTVIGTYAFLNASHVRELRIHDGIEAIDVGGFDFGHAAPLVVYEVEGGAPEAVERYSIEFPPGQAGRQATREAFSRGYFDLRYAYAGADNAVLVTQDVYIRAKAMLARLRNPVMLDARMGDSFRKTLARTLQATVVAFGRNGFPQGIDLLYEEGFLNEDNIDAVIDAASAAGEIAVLSRLVELRRTAFSVPMFDFDL